MRRITLVTRAGGQVHYVAEVEIPPFRTEQLPEVVVWGTRTFIGPVHQGARTLYAEAFAVVSLTPPPGLEPSRG